MIMISRSAKEEGESILKTDILKLSEIQEKLYASNRYSVLIVIQAMDAAGKDSVIKHVMSGLNPQGVTVTPFKTPTTRNWNTIIYGGIIHRPAGPGNGRHFQPFTL